MTYPRKLLEPKVECGTKKTEKAGKVPHTSIDTEAAWTKSGWHGWVNGWKL